jgi:hypothetical protein
MALVVSGAQVHQASEQNAIVATLRRGPLGTEVSRSRRLVEPRTAGIFSPDCCFSGHVHENAD